jgi:3-oxoacyl-[acyl-carrier-protein] synthase-3
VIGAEKLSQFVDAGDKQTAMLFGDAAGAVLLTQTAGAGELGPVVLRSEARRDLLYADRREALIRMDGPEVFKHAVLRMTEVTRQALAAAGTTQDEIELFVFHQANSRIVKSVGQRLSLDPARVVDCIERYGNVSAASIPLALATARDDGRLADGTRVLLAAFGAGFIWGAAVLDWRASA